MKRLLIICALVMLVSRVDANIILSTTETETLGGLTFRDADLAEYDPVTDTASLFFNEDLFASCVDDIDAVHVLDNGHIILSTKMWASIGGLVFRNGDLVEYDPLTDTATLFFSEDLFCSYENIDAVSILTNGNIVLSTSGDAKLAGLIFKDGDLVEYNPGSLQATLFLSEDIFGCDEDIDAVHVLVDGKILLSTESSATLAGLYFEDGDVIEYDPKNGTASLYFDEDWLQCGEEDVDAVHVPEPSTLLLLALGMLMMSSKRIRRRIM